MKVGVVGLGKIGICMAGVYARYGCDVVGVDINEKTLEDIRNKVVPEEAMEEKGLAEMLQEVEFEVSNDYSILKGTEVIIIILPTPSNPDGSYYNGYIINAMKSIRETFAGETQKPVVIVKSTVIPGSCEKEFIPLVEDIGMDVCYSAEMVGLGDVIIGLEQPEELLLGTRKKESGDKVEEFYNYIFRNRKIPPFRRMSLWNAELSKLALNVFLVSKVTLANTIARLCDENETGNINDVLSFIGNDTRIGPKFLVTGLGMGGVCFPRDSKALISLIGSEHINATMPLAIDKMNMNQPNYIYENLKPLPETVSVFGITYKKDTQIIEASMVLTLIDRLIEDGINVRLYDPKGYPQTKKMYGDKLYYADNIEDCLKGSELLVVGTTWDVYNSVTPATIKANMKEARVYDCWRIWNAEEMQQHGVSYHAFGINDKK